MEENDVAVTCLRCGVSLPPDWPEGGRFPREARVTAALCADCGRDVIAAAAKGERTVHRGWWVARGEGEANGNEGP